MDGAPRMIKKISTQDLKLGMFIHDLNAAWVQHGFWRQSFMLRREDDLQKIRESGILEMYIDTLRGLDSDPHPERPDADQALSEQLADGPASLLPPAPRVSLAEEMLQAREIRQEAALVVNAMMEDVRLGKQIEFERIEPVVARITDSITRNQGALLSLLRLKERDTYTFQHSMSVATLLVAFARSLELPEHIVLQAGMGGMVHDIGKMRIPDEVLNKPGRLSDEEFHVMRSHVLLGLEILERTPGVTPEAYEISGQHHERYSGTGYPDGLHGFEINQLGRMAAIVDTYDAMTANRVYQSGTEPMVVLRKLFEWSKEHFDPGLVQAFIQSVGIYPSGSLVRLDSGRLAVVLDQNRDQVLHPRLRLVFDPVRRQSLPPVEIDLADPHVTDRILGPENPADWGLDIEKLLAP